MQVCEYMFVQANIITEQDHQENGSNINISMDNDSSNSNANTNNNNVNSTNGVMVPIPVKKNLNINSINLNSNSNSNCNSNSNSNLNSISSSIVSQFQLDSQHKLPALPSISLPTLPPLSNLTQNHGSSRSNSNINTAATDMNMNNINILCNIANLNGNNSNINSGGNLNVSNLNTLNNNNNRVDINLGMNGLLNYKPVRGHKRNQTTNLTDQQLSAVLKTPVAGLSFGPPSPSSYVNYNNNNNNNYCNNISDGNAANFNLLRSMLPNVDPAPSVSNISTVNSNVSSLPILRPSTGYITYNVSNINSNSNSHSNSNCNSNANSKINCHLSNINCYNGSFSNSNSHEINGRNDSSRNSNVNYNYNNSNSGSNNSNNNDMGALFEVLKSTLGSMTAPKVMKAPSLLASNLFGMGQFASQNNNENQNQNKNDIVERRVDVNAEYKRAFQQNIIIRCKLIQSRNIEENNEGDKHFRLCESQFMRSFNHGMGMGLGLAGVQMMGGINNQKRNNNGLCPTIDSVTYVINPFLIDNFTKKKNEMSAKLGKDNLNIILAWHGTSSHNIKSIVENNFDLRRLAQNTGNRGFYGAGIYFSEFARISANYGVERQLLLCKVILGKQFRVGTGQMMLGAPLQRGFDSHVVNLNGQQYGQEVVIFDTDQILPCYIVHY